MEALPRRIVVTGSECTGKTTLASELAQALGGRWVPEFARQYAEGRGELGPLDVEPIAVGQLEAEDAALRQGGAWLVLDTDLLSTLVYARHYYARSPAWIEAAVRDRRPALTLLAAPDLPWVADGVRDRPTSRTLLHELFRDTLREFDRPAVLITGAGPLRLAHALAAVRTRWPAAG